MIHPIQLMMEQRRQGLECGIPSYCSANEFVLEAVLKRAKTLNKHVLIEATSNQVNQFGGYTGMDPDAFFSKVMAMAEKAGVPEQMVILGGDHLGPLIWQDEPEALAMKKAETLVYKYVSAGFTKIHLDTSMKLADDSSLLLAKEMIAKRGVQLYKTAMKAYEELKEKKPNAMRPVFVVGSEVPIPGGAQEEEDSLAVTKAEDFEATVQAYQQCFIDAGVKEGLQDVIAFVVQPGVEFGDNQVFMYDHEEAINLSKSLKAYPGLCFEGHSTDYQSPECLKRMVKDGIAILKVGPALTHGLREALFAMSIIERELVPKEEQSHFESVLEDAMLANPVHWEKYYYGNEKQQYLARRYSFSDRARYYINQPSVITAINKLFANLRKYPIPISMLHQYMPLTYPKVRDGELKLDPKELALDGIVNVLVDYEYASEKEKQEYL